MIRCLASLAQDCNTSEDNRGLRSKGRHRQKWLTRGLYSVAALASLGDASTLWAWATSENDEIAEARNPEPLQRDGEALKTYHSRYNRRHNKRRDHRAASESHRYARSMLTAASEGITELPLPWPVGDAGLPWCFEKLQLETIVGLPKTMKDELKAKLLALDLGSEEGQKYIQKLRHDSLKKYPKPSFFHPDDLKRFSPFFKVRESMENVDEGMTDLNEQAGAPISDEEEDVNPETVNEYNSEELISLVGEFVDADQVEQREMFEYYLIEAESLWTEHQRQPRDTHITDSMWESRTKLGVLILTLMREGYDDLFENSATLMQLNEELMDDDAQRERLERAEEFRTASILSESARIMNSEREYTDRYGSKHEIYHMTEGVERRNWWEDPDEINNIPGYAEYCSEMDSRLLASTEMGGEALPDDFAVFMAEVNQSLAVRDAMMGGNGMIDFGW